MSFLFILYVSILIVGVVTVNPALIIAGAFFTTVYSCFKLAPSWFEGLIYTIMILAALFFMVCNFFTAIQ